LDLDHKIWENHKINIVAQKSNVKDKKEKNQNIDAKLNIKHETDHEVIDRIYKEKLRSFCITIGYKSPFRHIPKIQNQKSQDTL